MAADPPDGRDEMQRQINAELRNWKPSARDQELATLRAEVERLRAALNNIDTYLSNEGIDIHFVRTLARAALAQEKQ